MKGILHLFARACSGAHAHGYNAQAWRRKIWRIAHKISHKRHHSSRRASACAHHNIARRMRISRKCAHRCAFHVSHQQSVRPWYGLHGLFHWAQKWRGLAGAAGKLAAIGGIAACGVGRISASHRIFAPALAHQKHRGNGSAAPCLCARRATHVALM